MYLKRCLLLLFILSSVILPACDSKQANPVDVYAGAVKRAGNAAETANLDAVRQSIQAYHAANGAYPASLKDLEGIMGSRVDISRYDYDPQTGVVTLKTQK